MDLKFNLKSLHRFENDLKLLLHMINVQDLNDVQKAVLNRSNKENLISFALNMSKLLKSSHELLKNSAADLDSLKCEQLQNQSKLIQAQEELSVKKSAELEAVNNTVDQKLTSWASVVEKNSSKKVTQKEMKTAVKSAMKDRDREYNVIMFNVEEQDEDNNSENCDAETAREIMNCAGLESDEVFATERIGSFDNEKNRPLKVKFNYKSAAFDLLALSKNLKDDANYFNVFIVPDRSREERIEHRKLVEQLKLKRSQDPHKRFYIWNKSIWSDD